MPACKAVIFSKDRPLQLDGLLRSLYHRCQDTPLVEVGVIYKIGTSSPLAALAYGQLMQDYPRVAFIPEVDFKRDLLRWLSTGSSDYVLFLVDDCLFWRSFVLSDAMLTLDDYPELLGVSLRLGRNITYSYVADRPINTPHLIRLGSGLLCWDWPHGDSDWGYPLEVSSSLYRSRNALDWLLACNFTTPNSLESALSVLAQQTDRYTLACYEQSVAYCVPANRVQSTHPNRAGSAPEYMPEALLRTYASGYRLDIDHLPTPIAVHQEIHFDFQEAALL